MCSARTFFGSLLLTILWTLPAFAQQPAVQWRTNLEAAKAEAQQTGRLVLVHFWTPTCGPCKRLDGTVFNQPHVVAAIQQRFVPVKLNAAAYQSEARAFGISQVPTDVIITAEGAPIGKLLSPPTPTAYISEVTRVANRYQPRPDTAFQQVAASPQQRINAAYAGLSISTQSQPASPPPVVNSPVVAKPLTGGIVAQTSQTVTTAQVAPHAGGRYAANISTLGTATALQASPTSTQQPAQSQTIASPYPPNQSISPAQITPSASVVNSVPTVAQTQQHLLTPAPAKINNPHIQVVTSPGNINPLAAQPPIPTQPQAAMNPNATAKPSTNVAALTTKPTASKITPVTPSQTPPLAFEGYCPVSMKTTWQWVKGDPRWGIIHRGRTYLFSSETAKKTFWNNPDLYSPALSGIDPVVAMEAKQVVDGRREFSLEYDGQFYMFASEESLNAFSTNPEQYAPGVRQAMGMQNKAIVR